MNESYNETAVDIKASALNEQ